MKAAGRQLMEAERQTHFELLMQKAALDVACMDMVADHCRRVEATFQRAREVAELKASLEAAEATRQHVVEAQR